MMKVALFFILSFVLFLGGCLESSTDQKNSLQDGYFTAKAGSFDEHGWSDFLTIYVKNNRIVSVEYDAQNASGFLRSWDLVYQQQRDLGLGGDSNKFLRSLIKALVTSQNVEALKMLVGHDSIRRPFIMLAQAAIEQSLSGNTGIVYITLKE